MKALNNIQRPMGGEPFCFHEAALIFIGHEHEICSLIWGEGEKGSVALFRCLHLSKNIGGAPTQVFGISRFSVLSEKTKAVFSKTFSFARSA